MHSIEMLAILLCKKPKQEVVRFELQRTCQHAQDSAGIAEKILFWTKPDETMKERMVRFIRGAFSCATTCNGCAHAWLSATIIHPATMPSMMFLMIGTQVQLEILSAEHRFENARHNLFAHSRTSVSDKSGSRSGSQHSGLNFHSFVCIGDFGKGLQGIGDHIDHNPAQAF